MEERRMEEKRGERRRMEDKGGALRVTVSPKGRHN
jgi:hypothetical protein